MILKTFEVEASSQQEAEQIASTQYLEWIDILPASEDELKLINVVKILHLSGAVVVRYIFEGSASPVKPQGFWSSLRMPLKAFF